MLLPRARTSTRPSVRVGLWMLQRRCRKRSTAQHQPRRYVLAGSTGCGWGRERMKDEGMRKTARPRGYTRAPPVSPCAHAALRRPVPSHIEQEAANDRRGMTWSSSPFAGGLRRHGGRVASRGGIPFAVLLIARQCSSLTPSQALGSGLAGLGAHGRVLATTTPWGFSSNFPAWLPSWGRGGKARAEMPPSPLTLNGNLGQNPFAADPAGIRMMRCLGERAPRRFLYSFFAGKGSCARAAGQTSRPMTGTNSHK